MRTVVHYLVALVMSCLVSTSQAQTSPLLVAIDENLYPYTFVGRDGKAVGADVELMQLAAKRTGLEIKFVPLPWKRVLQMLESGEVHLGMPLFFTSERDSYARYVAPMHFSATALFVLKDRPRPIKSVRDLYGKRIGYNRGYALPEDLALAISEGRIFAEEVNNTAQNVQKLLLGRVDAFVGNHVNTMIAMRGVQGSENIIALPGLLSTDRPAYLVFSRQVAIAEREKIEQSLKKNIENLHREGQAEQILSSYLKSN